MKNYEELAQEREDLKAQLEQYKNIKGHSSYKMAQNLLKEKQDEIKQYIKSHPR